MQEFVQILCDEIINSFLPQEWLRDFVGIPEAYCSFSCAFWIIFEPLAPLGNVIPKILTRHLLQFQIGFFSWDKFPAILIDFLCQIPKQSLN